jgi:hypothetical protein
MSTRASLRGGEDFTISKFIPKLAVERLDVTIFLGAAWLDE